MAALAGMVTVRVSLQVAVPAEMVNAVYSGSKQSNERDVWRLEDRNPAVLMIPLQSCCLLSHGKKHMRAVLAEMLLVADLLGLVIFASLSW